MDVYQIKKDGYEYQDIDLEMSDFSEIPQKGNAFINISEFNKKNMSFKTFWKNVNTNWVAIAGRENKIPDITTWEGATLLLSKSAYDVLYHEIKPFGEFLPCIISDCEYQMFNCLNLKNDLTDGKGSVLFKSLAHKCNNIFCNSRVKMIVESESLEGIKFNIPT